jgi:hypothetical protein
MRHKIKHKKKDMKGLYMSIFIVIMMVLSGFGVIFYGFAGTEETIRYEGHKFKSTINGFETKINKQTYYFDVLPQDTLDINTSYDLKNLLKTAYGIIITSEPNSSYKEEIAIASYNLNSMFIKGNVHSAIAFTEEVFNIPKLTCMNASTSLPVIEILESNVTEIITENNCIQLKFDNSFNLRRATAKISYIYLGVINE